MENKKSIYEVKDVSLFYMPKGTVYFMTKYQQIAKMEIWAEPMSLNRYRELNNEPLADADQPGFIRQLNETTVDWISESEFNSQYEIANPTP